MPTVHIPDLPDDVLRTLEQRAEASGMTLEDFLRAELVALARSFDHGIDGALDSVRAVRAERGR